MKQHFFASHPDALDAQATHQARGATAEIITRSRCGITTHCVQVTEVAELPAPQDVVRSEMFLKVMLGDS